MNELEGLLDAWPDSERDSDIHIGAVNYHYNGRGRPKDETTPPSSFQEEVTKPHGRAPVTPTPSITPKVKKFFTVTAVIITGIAGVIKLVYELVQGVKP